MVVRGGGDRRGGLAAAADGTGWKLGWREADADHCMGDASHPAVM